MLYAWIIPLSDILIRGQQDVDGVNCGSYCVFLYSARLAAVNWQMKLVRNSPSVCVFPAHIYVLLSLGYFERYNNHRIWKKILWKYWIINLFFFFCVTGDYKVFLNFCGVFCVWGMYKPGWAHWVYPGSSLAVTNINYVCPSLADFAVAVRFLFILFCHSCLFLSSFSELSVHLLYIPFQQWFSLFDLLSVPTSVLPIEFCIAPGYTVVLGLLLTDFLSPSTGIP